MWPLGRRADRTHTLFRAHSSQLGSANRYRWLAPADSRCEDMPWTRRPFPPPTLAPRLTGPLTGVPRWETPQPPLMHTHHHTQHHMVCWACPMEPRPARHTARTHRSQPQPTVDRATGTAVPLYRHTADDPQSVSTTARAAGSPSAPRRERQVERLPHVVAGDVDVDVVRPQEIGVDGWLRTPLECAHGEG